jgi:hypothetical protein
LRSRSPIVRVRSRDRRQHITQVGAARRRCRPGGVRRGVGGRRRRRLGNSCTVEVTVAVFVDADTATTTAEETGSAIVVTATTPDGEGGSDSRST